MTEPRRQIKRWLLVGLLLFDFLLFSAHTKQPEKRNWLDDVLVWISSPVQDAMVWIADGVAGIWNGYVALVGVEEENQALHEENERLKFRNQKLQALKAENRHLRSLFETQQQHELESVLVARVVGFNTSPVARTLRINRGSDDGVRDGDTVVTADGLVGRVLRTTSGYAEIRLIVDGGCATDVLIQRSRARGIVKGLGEDERSSMEYVNRVSDVLVDDVVITSGLGGAYPPGFVVGTVVQVDAPDVGVFQSIEVRPQVRFESLEMVMVLLSDRPDNPLLPTDTPTTEP